MKLKPLYLALLPASLLSGCSFNDVPEEYICFSDDGEIVDCREQTQNIQPTTPTSIYSPEKADADSIFKSNVNFVLLSEYVEQMAIDLRKNYNAKGNDSVAVTSFVPFDSSLQNSTVLGNQISEYFINELQNVGIPVSDHKVMGEIKVAPNGDFAMSRQLYELRRTMNVGYVLTGTLIENARGIIVNARIVSLNSNRVVATSSSLIPNLVWEN